MHWRMNGDIYHAHEISLEKAEEGIGVPVAPNPPHHLVDEDTQHVPFRSLERPERPSKVELDIVFLALHADAYQDSALGVQVEPKVVRKEVAIAPRVQTEVSATNRVVLSNQGAVSDADHQP